MIALLTGTIASERGMNPVIVDVHGVGYSVYVPHRISQTLTKGQSVVMHIHTHVREDALDLFGFVSHEELGVFNLLLTVSGVGPKTALGVLDHDAGSIRRAIEKGDVDFFTTVPRLGKKNAQKIIIELRSKLTGVTGALPEDDTSETKELADALVSMGFDRKEIREVIQKLPDGTLEVKIRHALRLLGKS
jgi:Holliday junction DNA helicase RuvA